jgi:hypothetical protein
MAKPPGLVVGRGEHGVRLRAEAVEHGKRITSPPS